MNAPTAVALPFGLKDLLDDNPVQGEQRKGARRFWTTREEKILAETYPTGGVTACLKALPGRSASAIYGHAHELGIKGPVASKPDFRRQRWTSSDAIDAVIRRAYQKNPAKCDILRCAKALGRPRWWVSKRAAKLGLVTPRFKEPEWTQAEIDLALTHAHKDLETIRRKLKSAGYARTTTAIKVKLVREGAEREDPDHFTANRLAPLMGVDCKTVTGWILKGLLRAKKRGTARTEAQGGGQWWIHRRDVRAFIIDNAAVVDIRKVDKFWFIDLLAGRAA